MNTKKPYCTVTRHTPGIGICCEIQGKQYHYRATDNVFYIYVDGKWLPMSATEQAQKPVVCQTLRDRYAAAQQQASRGHHAAETRRRRVNRGQTRAYTSH